MFETIFTILTRLETTRDAYFKVEGTRFEITLCDFDGFDANWCEVMREYEDAEMVDALFEVLDRADSVDDEFYTTYYFADCSATVGFTSYDI